MNRLNVFAVIVGVAIACHGGVVAPAVFAPCVVQYTTTIGGGVTGLSTSRVVLYRADGTYSDLFVTDAIGLFGTANGFFGNQSESPYSGTYTYSVDAQDASHATVVSVASAGGISYNNQLYFVGAAGGSQEVPGQIIAMGSTALFQYFPMRTDSGSVAFSTRCTLASGGSATSGIVIAPAASRWVLIRAVGASMANYGVSATAVKPSFTVYDSNGNVVANSVVWSADLNLANGFKTVFSMVGDFPLNDGSDEGVAVLPLAPGAYTAVFKAGGAGEIMCEAYVLPY